MTEPPLSFLCLLTLDDKDSLQSMNSKMKIRKSLLVNSGQNGNRWITTLKAVLSSLGKRLVVARPAELGRMLYEFDLIILDTRRTVDLRSTISNLRLQNPHASVVVCSSVPDWKETRQALLAGAADYFGKSLDQHLLLARLKETLPGHHWHPDVTGKNGREDAEVATLKTGELKSGMEQHMSPHRTILLVDNREETLKLYVKLFENRGYRVLVASTLEKAAELLETENVHLAVFDVDMHDHSDRGRTGDQSGLLFARDPKYRALPKIILTGYPSTQGAIESLRIPTGRTWDKGSFAGIGLSQTAAAVDYCNKGEDKFVEAVQNAFEQHVRINWELEITINNNRPISFSFLAELINPGLAGEKLLNRAEELQDLFRRLFYEANSIRIERRLWQREGRVALLVVVTKNGEDSEPIVVVCGQTARVDQERLDYGEFGPRRQTATTVPGSFDQTIHYGANTYSLSGADIENVNSFDEAYRFDSGKTRLLVNDLFGRTLREWLSENPLLASESCQELYRKKLGPSEKQESFGERLQALVAAISASGEQIELTDGTLTVELDHDKICSYPDPTAIIYEVSNPEPLQLIRTPGTLSATNILTDANGRTWLTDFADSGLAPQLWNHVAFEAVVRFDLTNANTFQDIFKIEHQLVERNFNLVAFKVEEERFSKTLDCIKAIRLLATDMVGSDTLFYHLGILYQAANRLAAFNPETKIPRKSVMRLAHALIAAAMICGRILRTKTAPDTFHRTGIRVENDSVRIDNDLIEVDGEKFRLIKCLWNNAGNNVSYEDLIRDGLGIERLGNNINALQVAIRRLREFIEPEPSKPRYILNEKKSYRLVPKASH